MAIATYNDLLTSLANWSHRSDLSSMLPDFIYLAERKISNNILSRELEVVVTTTTTAGVNSISLPIDYSALKNMQITGSYNSVLTLLPDTQLLEYNINNVQGRPAFFGIQGSNIYFSPIPDSTYTISYVYYQDVPALGPTNLTNWVLTAYPYVYLYGGLVELMTYIRDLDNLTLFQSNYQSAIEDMWENFAQSSFSGSPLFSTSDYIA